MSVVQDVFAHARVGLSPSLIAVRLNVNLGLVSTILDEGVRLGIVTRPSKALDSDGCSGCVPPEERRMACHGCVFAKQ